MRLNVFDIADALGLKRPAENTGIRNIVTDSREAGENTLFAALTGERADGHDFIPALDEKIDSIAFLASRPMNTRHACLVCGDVLEALGDIAALHLSKLRAKKIAITGSVGKTTTKEMVSYVLEGAFRTQKTLANRNNELGMPLTAFSVTEEHDMAVFEMGMRGFGQIEYLASRVRPDIGVVTNIGTVHMELLGSRENICKAKMELADHIAPGGVMILNGDEPLLRGYARDHGIRPLYFGIDTPADFAAAEIRMDQTGTHYTLSCDGRDFPVYLPVAGRHNVYNSLAAFAVAYTVGEDPDIILARLASFSDGGLRQNIYFENGILYFDDTYNASPEAVRASLDLMKQYPNRKIAVLADMLELGGQAPDLHFGIGEYCRAAGVDEIICYGPLSENTARGFGGGRWSPDQKGALRALTEVARENDMILFKGSHAMACDKLLSDFKKRWNER